MAVAVFTVLPVYPQRVGHTNDFENCALEFAFRNNQWITLTFELTKEYYSKNNTVQSVDFYIERGKADKKSANLEMDNFKFAWVLIKITDLQANLTDGRNIELTWKTTDEANSAKYKIYRANNPGFAAGETTFLAETETSRFNDNNLEPYKHYFYKVLAVSKNGEVFFPSTEATAETFTP